MFFYSKTTGGFYRPEIHGDRIPPDCVEVTPTEHEVLLNAQSAGKVIEFDLTTEKPIAVYPIEKSQYEMIKISIAVLEATITPRRLREALLGIDNGWLAGIDQQITDLRSQLT